MCTHTHTHAHTHTHTHTHGDTRTHTDAHTNTHTCPSKTNQLGSRGSAIRGSVADKTVDESLQNANAEVLKPGWDTRTGGEEVSVTFLRSTDAPVLEL